MNRQELQQAAAIPWAGGQRQEFEVIRTQKPQGGVLGTVCESLFGQVHQMAGKNSLRLWVE